MFCFGPSLEKMLEHFKKQKNLKIQLQNKIIIFNIKIINIYLIQNF